MNFASAAYPRTVSDRLHSWIQLSSSTVVLCGSLLVLLSAGQAVAAVTTAISPTEGTGSPVSLGTVITSGTSTVPTNLCTANCAITGGTRLGNNLFHSFGDFSIGALDGARFQTGLVNPLQDASVSNILGRVTGGNPSNIFGTLNTATYYPSANLFLMNPSGFVFGPNASLNVGGSVSFTTAQYIRFFDSLFSSAYFYANPANDGPVNKSILAIDPSAFEFLSATPAAYGFLTAPDPNASITVQGSTLSVLSGQSISLVGGKVVIEGGAQLSAPNGRILLATSASPGEFDATALSAGPNVENASFTSYGFASLEAGSSINVSGAHTVWIKGGQLVLSVNDATLNTSGSTPPQDTISLGPGSIIWTSNSGTDSSAPDLQLNASDVEMTGGAFILSQTDGPGRSGDVNVAADRVTIEQGAAIFTETFGEGAGGNVSIQGIQGPGSPAESVILSGGGLISNFTFGSGAGGGISITAKILDLNGGSTLQSSTFGSGPNGDILVSVQRASLSNGATFDSVTSFSGETPPVGGTITVQGLQGSGSKANSLTLEGPGTALKSEAFGGGRLGKIEVHAKTVNLMDGAAIKAGTPLDTATAGTITIDADSLGLSGGSSISSHAFNLDAGPVSITADQFSLDKSTIATDTSSPTGGHGGNVDLNVGSASLSNGATINSSASNTGVAGNINILASGSVTMTSGSTITASSTGTGNAGNISIKAGNQLTMTDSSITTEATEASGGQVTISAPEMVHLINSKITTSVAGSDTDTFGGNITIDPQFVVLQNSQILAQAFAGNGGKISIISDVFLADPFSQENISATSTLGISGTVDIRSPVSNISGIIGRLPESVLAAQALLRAACAARLAESQVSSFVERGRDSIPIGPDGLLATPYLPPSSEPSLQMGSVPVDSGRESWSESFRASAVQVRRLFGPDLTPRVQLLSGDASCGS